MPTGPELGLTEVNMGAVSAIAGGAAIRQKAAMDSALQNEFRDVFIFAVAPMPRLVMEEPVVSGTKLSSDTLLG
jgi:hypothetical protein